MKAWTFKSLPLINSDLLKKLWMFSWLILFISFIIHANAKDVYEDISNDLKDWFYILNYEINRPLPIGKNKKVIGVMKYELEGKILTKIAGLIPKIYTYSIDDGNSDEKL